jgi:hypothetical protein
MNASLLTADRTTHLKIIMIGLIGAIVITWLAIAVH